MPAAIQETRRLNLQRYCADRCFDIAVLAQRIQTRYSYARDLLAGVKSFGEKAARRIEEKLCLPHSWLDRAASSAPNLHPNHPGIGHPTCFVEAESATGDPTVGGFFVFFPSGHTITLQANRQQLKHLRGKLALEAANQYAGKILSHLLDRGRRQEIADTDWEAMGDAIYQLLTGLPPEPARPLLRSHTQVRRVPVVHMELVDRPTKWRSRAAV